MRTELASDMTMNGITETIDGKVFYTFTMESGHMEPRIDSGDTVLVVPEAVKADSVLVFCVNGAYIMGTLERDSKSGTSYLRQIDGRTIPIDTGGAEYIGRVTEARHSF